MKPLKLELQAFGPFADYQFVDFEKLSRSGMFLIKGKTGSGKTTIFDAMTFALYGGGSGEDSKSKNGRNDLEQWRCTQAEKDKPTFVALTFAIHGRKYFFKRSLTPKRVNLSAGYEAGELDADDNVIPFFENPKKDDLTNKAQELIGLTKEQFRQVIMLPQGQFERFLTAPSADKEAILKKIFDAEMWEKYTTSFYNKANERKTLLDLEYTEIEKALKEVNVSSVEELSDVINAKKTEQLALQHTHLEFDGEGKRRTLNHDRALSTEFGMLHSLEENLARLEGRKNEIDALRTKSEKAEKAEMVRGVIGEYERTQEQLTRRTNDLQTQVSKLEGAKNTEAEARKKKEEHEKNSPVESLTQTIGEYEGKREIYKSFEGLSSNCKKAQKSFNLAEKNAKDKKREYETARNAAVSSKQDFDRADQTAREYRDGYFRGIYGELAAQLVEGDCCPVCGSKDHPHPAKRTEDSVSKEDMEKAQSVADQKKKLWNDSETARSKAEQESRTADDVQNASLAEKQKAEADLDAAKRNLIEGISDEKALDEQIRRLKKEIEDYNNEAKKFEAEYKKASETLIGIQEAIRLAAGEKEKADTDALAAKEVLDKALAESGYSDLSEPKADMASPEARQKMRDDIVSYDTEYGNKQKELATKKVELAGQSEPDKSKFDERDQEIQTEQDEFIRNDETLLGEISRLSDKHCSLDRKRKHYQENIQQAASDLAFAKKLRGDTGIGLQRYVLAIMFNQVIGEANRMLEHVHGGRYHLFRTDDKGSGNKRGLELKVHDSRSPENEGRSVSMLSGGEKFLVSLALSIGMSTIAQRSGVQIEALFIDEGFGTLDDNSIKDAMNVLESVRKASGTIGIISHVQLLEANIPTHLEVVKQESGSRIVPC